MNNDDLYNDIGQVLKAIPFTANEILGFNLNNSSKYLCNNNKLRKTKWDIKEKIELLEKEKVVMMNVHNGFQIKNNDENVISLIKQNILIDNNGRISGNPNVFISLIGDKMIAFLRSMMIRQYILGHSKTKLLSLI